MHADSKTLTGFLRNKPELTGLILEILIKKADPEDELVEGLKFKGLIPKSIFELRRNRVVHFFLKQKARFDSPTW